MKNRNRNFAALTLAFFSTLNPQLSPVFAQGNLTPPGAPTPTMKTLAQIEPRTPISSLPHAITNAGSYYFTTNLLGIAGSNGIVIASSGVTLDLMGFELVGVAGSGSGINVSGICYNFAVRNGTIRNWVSNGINGSSAFNAQYDHLRVSSNGLAGLLCGQNSLLVNCTVWENGGDGIKTTDNCIINNCASYINNGSGILSGNGIKVFNCTSGFNKGDGMRVSTGSSVSECNTKENGGDGIEASSDCRIFNNTCNGNGNGATGGAGIQVTGSDNRIDSNNVTHNDRGLTIVGTGNLILRNSVSSCTPNYDIGINNHYGVVVNITGASAGVSGNSASSTAGTTDPWANFAY